MQSEYITPERVRRTSLNLPEMDDIIDSLRLDMETIEPELRAELLIHLSKLKYFLSQYSEFIELNLDYLDELIHRRSIYTLSSYLLLFSVLVNEDKDIQEDNKPPNEHYLEEFESIAKSVILGRGFSNDFNFKNDDKVWKTDFKINSIGEEVIKRFDIELLKVLYLFISTHEIMHSVGTYASKTRFGELAINYYSYKFLGFLGLNKGLIEFFKSNHLVTEGLPLDQHISEYEKLLKNFGDLPHKYFFGNVFTKKELFKSIFLKRAIDSIRNEQ